MYTIWHDNDFDFAHWVYENSCLKHDKVVLRPIPKESSASLINTYLTKKSDYGILPIIKLEKPDIIIQKVTGENSQIVFVSEFMTHTPQWQHPAQRFSRIYSSALLKIPTTLVLNRNKVKFEKKQGVYKEVNYSCSPSVFSLFKKTSQLAQSAVLLYFWPDTNGFPVNDLRHATAPFIDESIRDWFGFLDKAIASDGIVPLTDALVKKQIDLIDKTANIPALSDFTSIRGVVDTGKFLEKTKAKEVPRRITERQKSLIFAPDGLKCNSSPFRTDPYAGMLCAFDNLFCRNTNKSREINLILIAQNVSISMYRNLNQHHDYGDCPFLTGKHPKNSAHFESCTFTLPKYVRIYGEVADMIVFDDGIFYSPRGSLV